MPIKSVETIKWLKKRFQKFAQEHYLRSENENKQFQEIKTVFHNFDFDGSGKNLDDKCLPTFVRNS